MRSSSFALRIGLSTALLPILLVPKVPECTASVSVISVPITNPCHLLVLSMMLIFSYIANKIK